MADCKDCIHEKVCSALIKNGLPYLDELSAEKFCLMFKDKSKYIKLPCKVGDTVYVVTLCDDNIYRMFKMKITNICTFGSLYEGRVSEPFVWNLYLNDEYNYAYKTFYDIGKTVFLTREEAEKKLEE